VFALALALRIAYVLAWRDTLLFSTPVGDARAYLEWARAIAAGDWLGHEVFYQAPAYPYFLALVLRATGSETWGPRLVQALLGSLACVFLGRASARFFGRAVGLAAGAGLALYAPAIYFDGLIQKPALDGFLLTALLLALSGATPLGVGRTIGAGALLGLLALSRENALALVPVVALWLAIQPRVTPAARRALGVGGLALGLSLVLVPVGLRNQSLGDRFLITTAQLGPNLWIGNHPGATGRYEPLRPGRGGARFEREDARALAVAAVGRELSPAEVSDYWRDRSLAYMRERPGEWLRLLAHKAFLVVSARELPDTEGIEAYAAESLLLRALFSVLHFGVLAPLAVVGALSRRSEWRRLWLLPAMALALAASVALFYVFARYRYALVPVLMPLAAAGGVALWELIRGGAREWRAAVGLALAGVTAGVIANWPAGEAKNGSGLTHLSVGGALLEAGRLTEAQSELELAVTELPGFGPAHSRLGDVLRSRRQFEAAIPEYDRALALAPSLADAHAGRGMALDALGRDGAEAEYRRALSLDPSQPDANNNLAKRLIEAGHVPEALELFQRAHAARPDDPGIASNLGAALLRSGDPTRALSLLDQALTRDPKLASARMNRAAALDALGRRAEAQAELHTLLAQEPPDSPYARAARDALAGLGGR
jgi:tetratricopeptide (TPR) repeat protein